MNLNEIGALIKTRRSSLKLRQQELADLAQVNINTVVGIERGTGNPNIKTLIGICEILGLDIKIELS